MAPRLSVALGLATAFSAAACHVYVREPYAAYQPAPPPPQPVVRPAPQPPAPRAVARRAVVPPAAPAAETVAFTATTASTPSTPSPTAPAPIAPAPAAPAPAACLDNGAAPAGDCSAIKPADATCGRVSTAPQKCNAYKTYFDAKIAALAVACVTSLSSRQLCDPSQPLICAKTALAQACADPSVVQLCQIAATSCKITPGECSALLSGLNEDGQQAIAQCVAQGCPAGLGGCIDGLAKGH